MHIHFGGSIKAMEQYKEQYTLINQTIIDLGHTLQRDWVNQELDGSSITPEEMYILTEKAIEGSDAVILESTVENITIGQQLAMATKQEVPVLLLRFSEINENRRARRFVPKQKGLIVESTYTPQTIKQLLDEFFSRVESEHLVARFNLELERRLDNYLKVKAERNKTSKSFEIRKLILADMEADKGKGI